MPVTNGVGENPNNTPMKQEALNGLAGHLLGSAAAIARKWGKNAVILDMTCGPGQDGEGHPGSPVILGWHAEQIRMKGYSPSLVCVDRSHKNIKMLEATMQALYPALPVRYETSQYEALASLPDDTVGLAYFDPTHYTDLDEKLLSDMGHSFTRIDILFTRQCLAYLRMKGAAHTKEWALGIEDYLAATGKRCHYLMQYAKRDWWAFGFADNWVKRPTEKLKWSTGKLLSLNTPEGRALCNRLMKKEEKTWEQPPLPGMEEA